MSSNNAKHEKIGLVTSININTWNKDLPYITDILIEMSYSMIHKNDIENWSVKKTYKFIIQRYIGEKTDVADKTPGKNWNDIWSNISELTTLPHLHDIRFQLTYDIFKQIKYRLKEV